MSAWGKAKNVKGDDIVGWHRRRWFHVSDEGLLLAFHDRCRRQLLEEDRMDERRADEQIRHDHRPWQGHLRRERTGRRCYGE
jgi:hypothetical protein